LLQIYQFGSRIQIVRLFLFGSNFPPPVLIFLLPNLFFQSSFRNLTPEPENSTTHPANWINLGNEIPGTNGTTTVSDTFGVNPHKFYRLLALP
jgi:hypothetical protein